ncbi:hypothetical protein [Celeribacter neptunius]|uniref:Iron complex transport system permease protein n=1 Tax=Celeribacter neptunius TaxID=588602 RepID=A0A1I3LGK2_9RHOB|nr:hypothetical protein [Celeribacter neptunius]SFI83859.1 hypothetical protein SAMN04487991_1021 [Celeribacter neptunius]
MQRPFKTFAPLLITALLGAGVTVTVVSLAAMIVGLGRGSLTAQEILPDPLRIPLAVAMATA